MQYISEFIQKRLIILEFKALHGLYDDVISLGENCYTAIHLQKYKLRKHSGPLDWFTSPDLSSINDLLKNNFINFMDLNNMYAMADKNIVFNDGVIQTVSSYIVKDIKYKITSYHDFLVISFEEWSITYPEFSKK